VGAIALSGFVLVLGGLVAVLGNAGSSGIVATGGVLGLAELVLITRVVERRQGARVIVVGLALVQALGGVVLLVTGNPVGLLAIALAGSIVVPLATDEADRFFGVPV
jgi:hypothetical protein